MKVKGKNMNDGEKKREREETVDMGNGREGKRDNEGSTVTGNEGSRKR